MFWNSGSSYQGGDCQHVLATSLLCLLPRGLVPLGMLLQGCAGGQLVQNAGGLRRSCEGSQWSFEGGVRFCGLKPTSKKSTAVFKATCKRYLE